MIIYTIIMHCLVSSHVLVFADAGGCVAGSEGVRAVHGYIYSAGLNSQDMLCCMYMSGAHLCSLSEVIGHKLSKVVPLLLAEVQEYAVTIAIYTQLQLSLLLLI